MNLKNALKRKSKHLLRYVYTCTLLQQRLSSSGHIDEHYIFIVIFFIFNYFQSFKGMPIPDEEFLAVSIDAKIDYHQTVDLGKAKMSFKFISIY